MNGSCTWIKSIVGYKLSDGWQVSLLLFIVSGSLLAVVGNFLVLLTIYLRPLLHRVSYYLVVALALEDLLQGAIIGVFNTEATIEGCWQIGHHVCSFHGYISTWLGCTELLLIAAVTVDRYIACCKPLAYPAIVNVRRCKHIIAFCWIYSACISSLPLLGTSSYQYVSHLRECQFELSGRHLSVVCVCILSGTTALPSFVLILVCQIRIYKQVKRIANQPLPRISSSESSSAIVMVSSRPTKATRTVSLITGIYFLCWVPYIGVRIFKACVNWHEGDARFPVIPDLERASIYIFTVSKFANPIIYTMYNKEFRRECAKLLRLQAGNV